MHSTRKLFLVALAAGLLPVLSGTLAWLALAGGPVPPDARPALTIMAALVVSAAVLAVVWSASRLRRMAHPGDGAVHPGQEGSPPLMLRLARAFSLERRDLRGPAMSRFLLHAMTPQPRLARLPVNDVVAICVEAMLPVTGRRPAARIVFDPAPDAGHCALDPDQFHQVLLNLILNARDAAGASGLVSVRTQRIEDSVLLAVRDDGPGVPPSEIDRLFEPFRSSKPRALGVGLATCRAIVEAHGGSIAAMNVLPCGLEVTITLARVAAAPATAHVSSEPPAASRRA